MKHKTLIAYQDGRPDLERTARVVQERLGSDDREIVMKPVSEITVPEVLASRFFVFGADEVESAHFADLARILGGINLAGRKVTYFGSSGAAIAWL